MKKFISIFFFLLFIIVSSKADEYKLLFRDTLPETERLNDLKASSENDMLAITQFHNKPGMPFSLTSALIRTKDCFKTSDTLFRLSWKQGEPITKQGSLFSIFNFNSKIIICDNIINANIYRTEDSGKTWKTYLVHQNAYAGGQGDMSYSTLQFYDSLNGSYIYNIIDTLYVTHDGGKSWVGSNFPMKRGTINFGSPNNHTRIRNDKYWLYCERGLFQSDLGWINYDNMIAISDDSAKNWKTYEGVKWSTLGAPLFLDDNNALSVAIIRDSVGQGIKDSLDRKVAIYRSKDGGITWSKIYQSKYCDYATQKLKIIDNKYLIGTNPYGYLISSDMGETWESIRFDVKTELCFQVRNFLSKDKAILANDISYSIYLYTRGTSSVLDKEPDNADYLFPNPAQSIINVPINENMFDKEVKLSIYGAMGQMVKEAQLLAVGDKYLQFDVSDLSNGAYLLSIDCGGVIKRVSFVVAK